MDNSNTKVLITGAAQGMGCAVSKRFLDLGYQVTGIDIKELPDDLKVFDNFIPVVVDISHMSLLPNAVEIGGPFNIIVNCAGTASDEDSITINLIGTINICSKYAIHPSIKSVLNVVSVSAHNGAEYPRYTASKGGCLAYTKWLAQELAPFGATVNSISPGGVVTPMTIHIWNDPKKKELVLNETLLGKWCDVDEIADWIYFFTVVNKSATAQDIIIDNGETAKYNFIQ